MQENQPEVTNIVFLVKNGGKFIVNLVPESIRIQKIGLMRYSTVSLYFPMGM